MVNKVRKASWMEKKICTFVTIERKSNKVTLINEINGVSNAIMKRLAMNIKINVATFKRGHKEWILATFPSATSTKMVKLKMIKNFDESSSPVTRIAIQTIENTKLRIAVIGSIASL